MHLTENDHSISSDVGLRHTIVVTTKPRFDALNTRTRLGGNSIYCSIWSMLWKTFFCYWLAKWSFHKYILTIEVQKICFISEYFSVFHCLLSKETYVKSLKISKPWHFSPHGSFLPKCGSCGMFMMHHCIASTLLSGIVSIEALYAKGCTM